MGDQAHSETATHAVDGAAAPTAIDILQSLDVGVIVVDADLAVRFRNETASFLQDAPTLPGILQGARFLGPFDGWEREATRILESGETARFECVIRPTADAEPKLLNLRCTPMSHGPGSVPGGMVVLIEEQIATHEVEGQIEISKRLTSLGKLATRVAHELNNPLDGVLRYVNLAIRTTKETPDSKLRSYLAESRTGLMRMAHIIGDLLEFSRTSDGEFDDSDINEMVEQAMLSHGEAARASKVVIAADFQFPNMPAVHGSRLYQVCGNLIRNAIDAMPHGGRLSITTGVVNEHVVIRIADNGVGLPKDAARIFEPFFSTKAPGKGSGLGLAISREFVEDMGGTITAESVPGGGAVFVVRIPVSACQPKSRLGKQNEAAPVGHGAGLSPIDAVSDPSHD